MLCGITPLLGGGTHGRCGEPLELKAPRLKEVRNHLDQAVRLVAGLLVLSGDAGNDVKDPLVKNAVELLNTDWAKIILNKQERVK